MDLQISRIYYHRYMLSCPIGNLQAKQSNPDFCPRDRDVLLVRCLAGDAGHDDEHGTEKLGSLSM